MNLYSYFLICNEICNLNMHYVKKILISILNLKTDSSISGFWFLHLEKE